MNKQYEVIYDYATVTLPSSRGVILDSGTIEYLIKNKLMDKKKFMEHWELNSAELIQIDAIRERFK